MHVWPARTWWVAIFIHTMVGWMVVYTYAYLNIQIYIYRNMYMYIYVYKFIYLYCKLHVISQIISVYHIIDLYQTSYLSFVISSTISNRISYHIISYHVYKYKYAYMYQSISSSIIFGSLPAFPYQNTFFKIKSTRCCWWNNQWHQDSALSIPTLKSPYPSVAKLLPRPSTIRLTVHSNNIPTQCSIIAPKTEKPKHFKNRCITKIQFHHL